MPNRRDGAETGVSRCWHACRKCVTPLKCRSDTQFALCERYRLGKALRHQYDMAIVLPNSLKSAFIPLFAKIAVRRGWKGESRHFLLNDLRNNKRDYPMMVQRYVALAFEKDAVPKATDIPVLKPY